MRRGAPFPSLAVERHLPCRSRRGLSNLLSRSSPSRISICNSPSDIQTRWAHKLAASKLTLIEIINSISNISNSSSHSIPIMRNRRPQTADTWPRSKINGRRSFLRMPILRPIICDDNAQPVTQYTYF